MKIRISQKLFNCFCAMSNQFLNLSASCVATSHPNNFGWRTIQQTSLSKVCILGHNTEAVYFSKLPDLSVCFLCKPMKLNVAGLRKDISQPINQLTAKVLVEQ